MFKLAVLLFAAVAVQAISVDDAWQRQINHVKTMTIKVREITDGLKVSIETIKLDTKEDKRDLLEDANEFTHNVESVFYKMQQLVQDTQGEDKKILQQIAQELSETTYSVQKAIALEPAQLKEELKENIEKVATQTEKLAQHLEQTQKPQRDQDDHMKAMKRIVIDLHATLKKLKIQLDNEGKTAQEIYNRLHELAGQMRTHIQNVQDEDQQAVQNFADFIQRLCQKLNDMTDRLERDANDQEGHTKDVMQYEAARLSEIRRDLEKAINTERNTQEKAILLKEELNRTILNTATELQRLLQIVQQANYEGRVTIERVVLDGVAIAEITQAQLKMLKKH